MLGAGQLSTLERRGVKFDKTISNTTAADNIMEQFAEIALKNNMEIFTCAEERDFTKYGIPPGSCIDGDLIERLWSLKISAGKDRRQRPACLCMISQDIGANDTCLHGCKYCYATRNLILAKRRYCEHDPRSPVIWGKSRPLTEGETAGQMRLKLL